MPTVQWVKNDQNNEWFDFLRLDVNSPYFIGKRGVYAIWYVGNPSKIIKVGSGNIGERLREHKLNTEITKFSSFGQLKVTWAITDGINFRENQILGVECFLANTYTPLIGERYPNVAPEPVNPIN